MGGHKLKRGPNLYDYPHGALQTPNFDGNLPKLSRTSVKDSNLCAFFLSKKALAKALDSGSKTTHSPDPVSSQNLKA